MSEVESPITSSYALGFSWTRLMRGAASAGAIQGFGMAFKYALQILYARWLGADQFGMYVYALTVAQMLSAFGVLGLNTSALRFVPEYVVDKDGSRLRGFVYGGRRAIFGASIGIAFLAWASFGRMLENGFTLEVGLLLVPLMAISTFYTESTRGLQRIALAFLPGSVFQPAVLVTMATLLIAVQGGLTSVKLISLAVVSFMLTLVLQGAALKRLLWPLIKGREYIAQISVWLRVSLPLLIISGSLLILNQIDIVMIGWWYGPAEAGVYAVATKTAALVSFLLVACNSIAAPMIATFTKVGDRDALQRLIRSVARLVFVPSIILTIGFIWFGSHLLGVFGPGFVAGQVPLSILAIAQLVNASVGPVGYVLNLGGFHDTSVRIFVSSAILNILLNLVLIPTWGASGAAVATSTAMICWNLWAVFIISRRIGIRTFIL